MANWQHSYNAWLLGSVLAVAPLSCADAVDKGTYNAPGGFSSEVRGSQAFSYDSNPLRTASNAESIFGSTTSPQLILRKKTPLSVVESNTRVDANIFNRSKYNSVDGNEELYLNTENEHWQASVRGVAERDTTRTSELTNYALNLPRVYRTRLAASPRVAYRSSTFDTWSLNGSASDVTYDNRVYKDYAVYSISPSYEHRFDDKNTGFVSVTGQRYETTRDSSQRSDSVGPNIGFSSVITPRLKTRLSAGAQHTEKSGTNVGDSSVWNYVFSGNATYTGDRDTVDLIATRAREPFGNGTDTLLTTVSLKEKHAINPKLSAKVNGTYQNADYESAPGVNLDSGWNAGAGLSYKLSDNVSLDTDYRYRNEKLTTINHRIDQHVVMLSINYQPFWSRS